MHDFAYSASRLSITTIVLDCSIIDHIKTRQEINEFTHTHTHLVLETKPHVDKCTPLCVIHARQRRGLSDFIRGDAVEVRSLEPVPCLPYNRL